MYLPVIRGNNIFKAIVHPHIFILPENAPECLKVLNKFMPDAPNRYKYNILEFLYHLGFIANMADHLVINSYVGKYWSQREHEQLLIELAPYVSSGTIFCVDLDTGTHWLYSLHDGRAYKCEGSVSYPPNYTRPLEPHFN